MAIQPRFIPSAAGPIIGGPADLAAWAREVPWCKDEVFAIHLGATKRFGCFATVEAPCTLAEIVDEPDWLLSTAQACGSSTVAIVVQLASRLAVPTAGDREGWLELRNRHELAGIVLLDVVLVDAVQGWSLAFDAPVRAQRYRRC